MESAAEWTFLLYCGTVDNEFSFSTKKLLDLLGSAVISPRVNFVYEISHGDRTERGRIRSRDGDSGALVAEVLASQPPIETAAADSIASFIDWATRTFPSRYTALIFKDHASASSLPAARRATHRPSWLAPTAAALAHKDRLPRSGDIGMILADGRTQTCVSDRELRTIVKKTRLGHVDIYAFDACSMSTVEVAYEIRNVASYMVASEEYIGDDDFPYAGALTLCSTELHVGPHRLSRELAPKSTKRRTKARLVAVELAWMDLLTRQLDDVAGVLCDLLPKSFAKIADVQGHLTAFPGAVQFDLLQVLEHCGAGLPASADLARCVAKAKGTLDKAWSGTPPVLDKACGLGIFFPAVNGVRELIGYGALAFPHRSRWGQFLAEFCFQAATSGAASATTTVKKAHSANGRKAAPSGA